MGDYDDRTYLIEEQYEDSSNLNARQELHRRFSTSEANWFMWVFDQFDLPPDARVLELGCGPGDLWLENADRIPPGWEITLSDLSPGMVADARANLSDVPFEIDFEVIGAQSAPFGDETFNAVVANHILYHVPNPSHAFEEIRHVLVPGGRLYAATNGRRHMGDLYELVNEFEPGAATRNHLADNFRLENGGDQLRRVFETVDRRRFDNDLRVTDVEPLVAYVASAVTLTIGDIDLDAFETFVSDRLSASGSIHITKDTGLFVAEASE